MENELVKAELAGLTGDDAEYDRLVEELSEALDHLEQTAQSGRQSEDDAQAMIDALQSAGNCYWNLGFLDESRDLYEDSLSRLIDLHSDDNTSSTGQQPPDHPQIAKTLHWLGSIHARSGNPTEAARWYESALDMKKRVYGNRTYHPEIGRSLNGLALVQVHQASPAGFADDGGTIGGDEEAWRHAMELFQEAERNFIFANMDRGGGGRTGIATPASALDDGIDDEDYSNHPDLAMICENMAMLFRQNNEHQAALTRYQQALAIRQSNASSSDEDGKILGLMLSVADSLRALSKFDEAAALYEQVLAKKANGGDGESHGKGETRTALEAVIRHSLGLIHSECGRHELALEQYSISKEIKIALAGHDHPEVAVTLNATGAVHGANGDREQALAHFRQALQIFQLHSGALGDDDPDVCNTLRNIRIIEKSALKTGKEDRLTMM